MYDLTKKVHCNGSLPLFQQSEAEAVQTADSSALLEWRNKLMQHYLADREDESRQVGTSGILIDLQSWLGVRLKDGRDVVEITHHTLSTSDIMTLSCRASGTILRYSCQSAVDMAEKTSTVSGSHSHFSRASVIILKRSTDTFSRE